MQNFCLLIYLAPLFCKYSALTVYLALDCALGNRQPDGIWGTEAVTEPSAVTDLVFLFEVEDLGQLK